MTTFDPALLFLLSAALAAVSAGVATVRIVEVVIRRLNPTEK